MKDVAKTVAVWLRASGLRPGDHHEKIKKAWRGRDRVNDPAPGVNLNGTLLRQVRNEMVLLNEKAGVAPPTLGAAGDPALEPPAEALSTHADNRRAHYEGRAAASGGIPAAEVERMLAEARNEATQTDDWGGELECGDCAGTGKHTVAGNYCRCPLGDRRRREDAANPNTEAGEEPAANEGPEGGAKEDDVKVITRKKPGNKKARPTGGKVEHDLEAAKALKAKYPKIKEIMSWSEISGRPERVLIRCQSGISKECEKTRELWTQDLFQVHNCRTCQTATSKIHRLEKAPAKKPAKK